MSEIKFACPVCGQHITVDSSASGTKLACPTCFRQLVVPSSSAESKLVLSATEVTSRERAMATPASGGKRRSRPGRWAAIASGLLTLAILFAGGATLFYYGKHLRLVIQPPSTPTNLPVAVEQKPHSNKARWTLTLSEAVIPDREASGVMHGKPFDVERAVFRGTVLSLRQGTNWPPEKGISIQLFSDQVGGKTIEVTPERNPPLPRITVRWEHQGTQTNTTLDSGYALKLRFDEPSSNRISGSLYLALPESKTFVAGTFDAAIVKPNARRSRSATTKENPEVP